MSIFLQIEGAEVSFGATRVLRGVSVGLDRGKCLVLLGPSGCGKTTLLNVIAGMTPLDAGRCVCDGIVLDDPAARRFVPLRERGFATVFQDFSLWPHMTVDQNVAFGLRVRGVPEAERARRVAAALEKVRMSDFPHRMPASLSGGQQQRVAIARAMAVQPKLLLLDEPLSALDARLREELRGELSRLLREEGQTAVYVTHDQAEAFALGDLVAVMRDGRIEQLDESEQLYHKPRTRFVAEFIGAANVAPFAQQNGHLTLGGRISLPTRPDWPERGFCFIRREGVRIRAAASDSPGSAVCLNRQFLGSFVEIRAGWPGEFEMVGEGLGPLSLGARVSIEIDPACIGFLADSP